VSSDQKLSKQRLPRRLGPCVWPILLANPKQLTGEGSLPLVTVSFWPSFPFAMF